ncbi:MAG: EF-P lysine aminoacylase EpmA [Pirellulaceae bacterium]|nr:EF-P lysine aminoacylase EpmA [Pirellulaceae bacterium]
MSDFAPTASWERLRRRAALLHRLRTFFNERGFLEVETPILSADTVVDRHLDPMQLLSPTCNDAASVKPMWLQTSPEFGMKRMLASGAEAIYQVTRAFRHDEQGSLHNPEFTIAEWYRVGDGLQAGMDLLAELAGTLLATSGVNKVTYGEAFQRYAGVDPHRADLSALYEAAASHGIAIPAGYENADRDHWLDLLLVSCVEQHLGRDAPTIVYDYPASQAMLAGVRDGDPPVAERFELYVDGVELANGYHELLDAAELRRRNARANEQRRADGKPLLPESIRLLAAMDHGLPACCGVALGFDRLVMAATGARDIREVIAFPFDRA